MFDKLEFDKKNKEEWQRQLDSLQKRLYEAIVAHNSIREAPISPLPTEEEIKELEKITIPQKGRDVIEVEGGLV